jgi:uncharacterized protein (TIGR03435 family)
VLWRISGAAVGVIRLSLLCAIACAQQRPAFEGADVHVSPPGTTESGGTLPDGVEFRATTLLQLITFAYSVPADRVVGGPSWLDTDRFDILAKTSRPMRQIALRDQLQSLLAERFALVIARGAKPVPAYVLTVVRPGVWRESGGSAASECDLDNEGNIQTLACRNTTIAELIVRLPEVAPAWFRLPIVDRTGLTSAHDFTLRYAPPSQIPAGSNLSLFASIEKQTGIRVAQQTAPVPVLTVVRVNRTPNPNPPDTAEKLGPPPAEFDVASIRPSRPDQREDFKMQNGRIEARAIRLRDFIAFAYNVEEEWVRGEKWIESTRFDVLAKTAPTNSDDTLRIMLQSLLSERFHLKVHKELQPVEVYALLAARPKLKPADPSTRATCRSAPTGTTRTYNCQNATLGRLVDLLNDDSGGYLHHKVVDLTGMTGAYDFTLTWDLPLSLPSPDSGQIGFTLFEAIDRQLGLKLSSRKHPMLILIVDHIDRQPTEN